jgi:hypothetical protein
MEGIRSLIDIKGNLLLQNDKTNTPKRDQTPPCAWITIHCFPQKARLPHVVFEAKGGNFPEKTARRKSGEIDTDLSPYSLKAKKHTRSL